MPNGIPSFLLCIETIDDFYQALHLARIDYMTIQQV